MEKASIDRQRYKNFYPKNAASSSLRQLIANSLSGFAFQYSGNEKNGSMILLIQSVPLIFTD